MFSFALFGPMDPDPVERRRAPAWRGDAPRRLPALRPAAPRAQLSRRADLRHTRSRRARRRHPRRRRHGQDLGRASRRRRGDRPAAATTSRGRPRPRRGSRPSSAAGGTRSSSARRSARGGSAFLGRGPELDVASAAPRARDLELTTHSADLDARGRLGDVEVRSASGDATLGDARSLAFTTASGDLSAGAVAGALTVKSASGDVDVRSGRRHRRRVTTVSGDVRDRRDRRRRGGEHRLGRRRPRGAGQRRAASTPSPATSRVASRPGLALWIDVQSVSGSVTSDLDVGDAPDGESRAGGAAHPHRQRRRPHHARRARRVALRRRPARVLDSLSWRLPSRQRSASRSTSRSARSLTILGVFAVAWAFVAARQAVLWIFIALFLAIVLQTPVSWLEQRGLSSGRAPRCSSCSRSSRTLVGLAYLLVTPVRRRDPRPDRGPAEHRRADPRVGHLPAARPQDRPRRGAAAAGRVACGEPPVAGSATPSRSAAGSSASGSAR